MKRIYSMLSLTLLLFVVSTYTACAQNSNDQNNTAQSANFKTIKLKVGGITCSGDCKDIQKVVSKMNGVKECIQIGKPASTSVFQISFDPKTVSEKDIRKTVEGTPGCDNPDEKPYKVKDTKS